MKGYRESSGRNPDFYVRYSLLPESEGGRKVTYQHLRCDFAYEGDNIKETGIYIIHPEFLDELDNPIEEGIPVPLKGRAAMWILFEEMKSKNHKKRMTVGTKGFFMEGSRKIGFVVIERLEGILESGT